MIERAASIQKTVLDNGLTILTEEMNQVRSASVGIWVRSGSRHEQERLNGISHFIEHTLFKGTRNRTSREIAVESDAIGGNVDAFTSREVASYYVKVLDEHLRRWRRSTTNASPSTSEQYIHPLISWWPAPEASSTSISSRWWLDIWGNSRGPKVICKSRVLALRSSAR